VGLGAQKTAGPVAGSPRESQNAARHATKDHEVVEYALSRTVSPALVAEYETKLPDKKLLQAKLHEFYQLAEEQREEGAAGSPDNSARLSL
jgi:hypothetical protein